MPENAITFISQREKQQAAQLAVDEEQFEAGKLPLDEFIERNFDALYERHFNDMPYGTLKARTGDPYEWLSDRYSGMESCAQYQAEAISQGDR